MSKKVLQRELKRAAITRMEDGARTEKDFREIIKQWNHLDENRERRERNHEVKRNEETIRLGYSDGYILPIPFLHPAWRGAINGDFIDIIFDNAGDVWQLVTDGDIAALIKAITDKQKEVLFFSAVRGCTPQQIACYKEQTDRAIRKLLAAALMNIRDKLAPLIRKQIDEQSPGMTSAKRQFLDWYENKKIAIDNTKGE